MIGYFMLCMCKKLISYKHVLFLHYFLHRHFHLIMQYGTVILCCDCTDYTTEENLLYF